MLSQKELGKDAGNAKKTRCATNQEHDYYHPGNQCSQNINPVLFATKATLFPLCHSAFQVYMWTRIINMVCFVIYCNKVTNVKEGMKIGRCGEYIWVEKEI